MQFEKSKCQILQLGQGDPDYIQIGVQEAGEHSHRKGAGVSGDNKLNLSQQCTLVAQRPTIPYGASGPAQPLGEGRDCPGGAHHRRCSAITTSQPEPIVEH